jgi:hypothetical protein
VRAGLGRPAEARADLERLRQLLAGLGAGLSERPEFRRALVERWAAGWPFWP